MERRKPRVLTEDARFGPALRTVCTRMSFECLGSESFTEDFPNRRIVPLRTAFLSYMVDDTGIVA